MDDNKTVPAPSIYAYSGIPQHQAEPVFGSYEVLRLRADACFDRFGRFGSYGLVDGRGSGKGDGTEGDNDTALKFDHDGISNLAFSHPDGLD